MPKFKNEKRWIDRCPFCGSGKIRRVQSSMAGDEHDLFRCDDCDAADPKPDYIGFKAVVELVVEVEEDEPQVADPAEVKLREMINDLGGLSQEQPIDEVLGDLGFGDVLYLTKSRQYNPNGQYTYNNYSWLFETFDSDDSLKDRIDGVANDLWEAPGWELIGIWNVETGEEIEFELGVILGDEIQFRKQNPDGGHLD